MNSRPMRGRQKPVQVLKNLYRFLNLHRLYYYFDRSTGRFFYRSKNRQGDRQTGFLPVDRFCRQVRLPSPVLKQLREVQLHKRNKISTKFDIFTRCENIGSQKPMQVFETAATPLFSFDCNGVATFFWVASHLFLPCYFFKASITI